jgi:hypothetical protein
MAATILDHLIIITLSDNNSKTMHGGRRQSAPMRRRMAIVCAALAPLRQANRRRRPAPARPLRNVEKSCEKSLCSDGSSRPDWLRPARRDGGPSSRWLLNKPTWSKSERVQRAKCVRCDPFVLSRFRHFGRWRSTGDGGGGGGGDADEPRESSWTRDRPAGPLIAGFRRRPNQCAALTVGFLEIADQLVWNHRPAGRPERASERRHHI